MSTPHVKHQLFVHLDAHPLGAVDIVYSYPLSDPFMVPETRVGFGPESVPKTVYSAIETIRAFLVSQREPITVRFPHTVEISPDVQPAILTVVTQDQHRAAQLPIIRLYAYEAIPEVDQRREIEVGIAGEDLPKEHGIAYETIRQFANKEAWRDYEARLKPYLRS